MIFEVLRILKGLLKIASQARRKFAVGKYCESLKRGTGVEPLY
jgi:hypothetical protein